MSRYDLDPAFHEGEGAPCEIEQLEQRVESQQHRIAELERQLAERDAEIAAKESQLEIAAEVTRTDVAKCEAEIEKLRQWQRDAADLLLVGMCWENSVHNVRAPEWDTRKTKLLSEVEGDE